MHRILLVTLLTFLFSSSVVAQQLPLFTQYAFDPYLVNPSMVASGNRAELNALYRRQWTAIPDGPKTMQFDAQIPFSTRVALGLNVYNDKTVLLNATSALLTFGYRVPLATNHTLGFGISGGIFSNRLDMSGLTPAEASDPALLNATSNNLSLNGQFGAHYRFRNFTLGFSMVNLFERKTFTPESFQKVKFGGLRNQIYFTSYRFTIVEDNWYFQPNVMYRVSEDKINYYEASGFITYKNIVDLGGGYRQNFGPAAMLRLSWKQIQVGFAYDFPSIKAQVSTGGSQEIQIKWRFGKLIEPVAKKTSTPEEQVEPPKEEKKTEVAKVEEKKEEPVKEEPKVVQEQPKEQVTPPVVTQPVVTETQPEKKVEVTQPAETHPPIPAPGTDDLYFVIGTFESKANAQKFLSQVRQKGVAAELRQSKPGEVPFYYYVHMPQYKVREVTLDRILELQKTTGFKDAWFKRLD